MVYFQPQIHSAILLISHGATLGACHSQVLVKHGPLVWI